MFGTPALWHDFVFKLPFYIFYSAHLHALKICAPLQCRSFCHASCFTSIHHLNLSADTRSIYQIWSTAIGSGIELASYHLIVPSKSLSGHEIPSTFFLHIWLRLRLFFPPFQQPLSLTSNRPSYQSSTLCTDRGRCHGSITGMCQARKQVSKKQSYYGVAALVHVRGHQCILGEYWWFLNFIHFVCFSFLFNLIHA